MENLIFPANRIDSRVHVDSSKLTIMQGGQQYNIQVMMPQWLEKILGAKSTAHSILAPMPCKILRTLVTSGDEVDNGQPLIIIESMKMETTISSPQRGIISRVAHSPGVSVNLKNTFLLILNGHRTSAKRELP